MNKQELASQIWTLANNLRGKVSAATYKDYMLGFLFYKYLSDKEEKYLINELFFEEEELIDVSEQDEKTKRSCMDNLGYFISYDNLFSTWVKDDDFSIENVTKALSAFERYIGEGYKKVFSNIFSTLSNRLMDLGTTDPERTKNSREIIKLVKSIPTDNKEDYDVLGFIYEFLLKNFAANAGKAGEFYTPNEASIIMAEIIAHHLKDKDEISIYDPTSGSGSLLINIGKAVSKYLGNKNKVKYFAQELIGETYNLTRMNLVMRDVLPSNIVARQGDTLDKDWPYFDETDPDSTYDYLTVDACCSNPPYSQPWEPKSDPRFDNYGLAPKSKADYAFLLHNLYHLNKDGIMTIVLPHGVLFRGGEEEVIRTNLIKERKIETIIGLPANLFYGTGIPTIIMVLKKNRENNDILFIDASKGFTKDGNKNKLRARDIRKIVDSVIERKEIPYYSLLVKYDEIQKNDFNLNISRYVDSNIKETPHDIYALMFGGIPNNEINGENFKKIWKKFPSLKEQIFVEQEIPYSTLITKDILEVINKNNEIQNFISEYKNSFDFLKKYLEQELLDNFAELHLNSEENKISEVIKKALKDNDLIDYYDCFEIFDDCWQSIILDLEIIKEQGLEAARVIDEVKVLKKDSKTKKLEEKVIGYDGRIIPFSLIQETYFNGLALEIKKLENELSNLLTIKEELLESFDPDDKAELLKDDDSGDIDTKKLNKKIAEIKKAIKKGAEFENDSYEDIIINISKNTASISSLKKDIKKKKDAVLTVTSEKLLSLTDEDIKDLLIKKWILPICDGIDNIPTILFKKFILDINALCSKYKTTFDEIEKDIIKLEDEISNILDELIGDEYDIKGINQLNKLLKGDENNEQASSKDKI